jgi:integrase
MAYKTAILSLDPLADDGRKKVRLATADAYERMIRRMATAALANGAAAEDVSTLARLVGPLTLRRALEFFLARNGGKVNQQAHDMAHLALGIAKHWAHLPEEDIAAIKRLAKKCSIKRHGLTQKNRDGLQQLRDEMVITKLVNLPQQLLDQAQKGEVNCRTAMMAQTAVALAILFCAPIRIKNLRSLDRSRHFKPAFSTKGPVMQLVIPGEEVKNDVDLVFPLRSSIMDLIDLYLKEYQPLLCRESESSFLFPGRDGRPKSDNKLRDQIEKAVWSNLGIHVHPHLFRHIAALIFLAKYPGQYEQVRRLLGHKSIETTIRFYAGLETTAAVNCYNEIIEGYRSNSDQKKG